MPKQNVQIDIPKEVKGKARQEYLATARELLKEQTVLRLFEEGKASAGYAANLLGLKHSSKEFRTAYWLLGQ
jgi:predicted HTH domain antitoxin